MTLVPTGGLDKVATFVALLGASGLKLGVLHDNRGAPDQKLMDLVKDKLIKQKVILNVSQFVDLEQIGTSGKAADIEDIITPKAYLALFNETIQAGVTIKEADLPPGDRIVDRIERCLVERASNSGPRAATTTTLWPPISQEHRRPWTPTRWRGSRSCSWL